MWCLGSPRVSVQEPGFPKSAQRQPVSTSAIVYGSEVAGGHPDSRGGHTDPNPQWKELSKNLWASFIYLSGCGN